jgi:hypothetical protein
VPRFHFEGGGEIMLKKLFLVLVSFAVLETGVHAQSELQRIADALDVSSTKTFQFTGTGVMYSLGQSTSPMAP